ncbi:MAG: uroporphyrinogen decarboxylase family protein [Bacteroidota bacterium]
MLTGRERVKATLTFSRPDRPPRDLWALPFVSLFRKKELDALLERFPLDIGRPEVSPGSDDQDIQKLSQPGSYVDEWGSVWYLGEPGIVGEVKEPVLSDWSRLPTFHPPWETIRKRDWSHVNRLCDQSEQFMVSSVCARPFERLQFLRGTENLYIDLGYDSKEFRTLVGMVHDFYREEVTGWADSNVDGVFLMDDWGSNESLLISPAQWREVFKPIYKDFCDIIHGAGKHVFFHSDGHIAAIYGDLIEIGVDALNSQLFCMDIESLARQHKGKLTFWGEIDRQSILPFGTQDEVRAAVRRVRSALDDGSGGVIAQCEWGKDNSRENVEAVFEAWL